MIGPISTINNDVQLGKLGIIYNANKIEPLKKAQHNKTNNVNLASCGKEVDTKFSLFPSLGNVAGSTHIPVSA